jgi:hypothetical protein
MVEGVDVGRLKATQNMVTNVRQQILPHPAGHTKHGWQFLCERNVRTSRQRWADLQASQLLADEEDAHHTPVLGRLSFLRALLPCRKQLDPAVASNVAYKLFVEVHPPSLLRFALKFHPQPRNNVTHCFQIQVDVPHDVLERQILHAVLCHHLTQLGRVATDFWLRRRRCPPCYHARNPLRVL